MSRAAITWSPSKPTKLPKRTSPRIGPLRSRSPSRADWSSTRRSRAAPQQVVVQDSTLTGYQDPIGNGWGIDGVDRLTFVCDAVLWVSGDGQSRLFNDLGGGNYQSPAGDFGTLVQNSDFSSSPTPPRTKVHIYFNQSGLMTASVDRDGVAIDYFYNKPPMPSPKSWPPTAA